jgi:large subunit ribosomal protein L1
MVKISKRFNSIRENIDKDKSYELNEGVKLIKGNASAKFDETIEIAVNLGVDPRHADQMVRGVCQLPEGTGRDVRVAVFAKGDKAKEAKDAGADIVGDEDLSASILNGEWQ